MTTAARPRTRRRREASTGAPPHAAGAATARGCLFLIPPGGSRKRHPGGTASGPRTAGAAPHARAAGEAGTVTLWLLGLCVVLLFVGGIGLDLWRAFSERRALASAVDAAAVAGASGIDTATFRATQQVVLDPALAEELAAANLAAQTDLAALTGVTISATPARITVEAAGAVDLTLTKMLLDPEPLDIRVTATAEPHRSP